jgi:hypothetical protein
VFLATPEFGSASDDVGPLAFALLSLISPTSFARYVAFIENTPDVQLLNGSRLEVVLLRILPLVQPVL